MTGGIFAPPPQAAQHLPVAVGKNGMVASAQPLAAATGLKILMEGGNAFDAAIAMALVEDVTLPAMSSLGGDLFALVYHAGSNQIYSINGNGASPKQATPQRYADHGYKQSLPLEGIASPSIPGEVHALSMLHEKFGSLSIDKLITPAYDYASEGFPVNERLKWRIQRVEEKLKKYSSTASIFLPHGSVPEVGEVLIQKDLANTLRLLIENGWQDFYQGEVAEKLVRYMEKSGGLIQREDLLAHQTDIQQPISTPYRGYQIYETTPTSHGVLVLQMLNILEGFNLSQIGHSSDLIHLMAEAKKLCYSDRLKYIGDPRFIDYDLDTLLSKSFAATRRAQINPHLALEHYNGLIEYEDGDTTYLCVADKEGNCISLIHSLSGVEFGSMIVPEGTGVVLNSRLGRGFSLHPLSPNVLAPNKRTMHTLNAYMIFENGLPRFIGGTPGGDQQPQWNVQTIVNLLDFKLNVQQAAEFPRWYSFPGTDDIHLKHPFELRLEGRFERKLGLELENKGHRVKWIEDWSSGGVQLIEINQKNKVYLGGSDPRIGGIALGY